MIKFEIIYDPADRAIPLKLNCPKDVNPNLIITLMSQIITALSMSQVAGNAAGLIIPAANLPKVQ